MKMRVILKFNSDRVERAAHRGALRGLRRSAAYVRTVVKRSIRKRKDQTSQPGMPPFDHGTFRQSMQYSVDARNLMAYVGPARLINKFQGAGEKIAPETLEFGGRATFRNRQWFTSKPPAMTTISQVALFLRGIGYGPMYAGVSAANVMDQSTDNSWWNKAVSGQSYSKRAIKQRKRPDGKNMYYLSLPLKSPRMAMRAARIVVANFGFPVTKNVYVRPRPYLKPGLAKAESRLPDFFKDSMNK